MSIAYLWRKLTPEAREKLLEWRKQQRRQWHRPQHRSGFGNSSYHITAACYEHSPHIGKSVERMQKFSTDLLAVFDTFKAKVYAWCLLPNHYHVLAQTTEVEELLWQLGRLSGRTSNAWNREDITPRRKTWCGVVERLMKSDAHFWSTINYVHHNPVRHRYVSKWQDWPFSSASDYIRTVGRDEAEKLWNDFPLADYGEGWDDPEM